MIGEMAEPRKGKRQLATLTPSKFRGPAGAGYQEEVQERAAHCAPGDGAIQTDSGLGTLPMGCSKECSVLTVLPCSLGARCVTASLYR